MDKKRGARSKILDDYVPITEIAPLFDYEDTDSPQLMSILHKMNIPYVEYHTHVGKRPYKKLWCMATVLKREKAIKAAVNSTRQVKEPKASEVKDVPFQILRRRVEHLEQRVHTIERMIEDGVEDNQTEEELDEEGVQQVFEFPELNGDGNNQPGAEGGRQ